MKPVPVCCFENRGLLSYRGLCFACETKLRQPRKVHTVESAMVTAADRTPDNLVGSMRLVAWALRRDAPGDLRFEQGPGACAALLRR
jgi:hypothetical protein